MIDDEFHIPTLRDLCAPLSAKVMPARYRETAYGNHITLDAAIAMQRNAIRQKHNNRPREASPRTAITASLRRGRS